MTNKHDPFQFGRAAVGLALVLALGGCSGNDPQGLDAGSDARAISPAAGAMMSAGGATTAGGTTSGTTGTGGGVNAGGTLETGGAAKTGGVTNSGGSSANEGGTSGPGGIVNAGGSQSSGGAMRTGGSSPAGGSATGGANTMGGTPNSGGTTSAGGSTGTNSACPGADAAEFALVRTWLSNTAAVGALPSYAYSNIKTNFPAGAAFNKLACSIAMSCVEFAPAETDWLRKCEAVLTSAIVAESSYNPNSVVTDSYATRAITGGTANDPTVGLLQIRFSSTVHDYNYNGPMAKMAGIGCSWPAALTTQADTAAFWATAGGTTYVTFMQDIACNIGLTAWYYFYNATGNGGPAALWISDYCANKGIAGNMVVGLLSHLQGGSYTRPADPNNAYPWGIECCTCGNPSGCSCTGCTGRFAAFMGIGSTSSRPSPDPFLETLSPEPTKYCK